MKTFYIVSLGCPRNLVDSEVIQGKLEEKGFTVQAAADGSDAVIVNTCGFIEDAKQESIDIILQLAEMKKEGKIKSLIVTGCLSQRYPDELMEQIKEIDGLFGTSDIAKIAEHISVISSGKRVKSVSTDHSYIYDHSTARTLLTPPHYSYIKIQEGCSNRCSYCVIPDLRGPLRSRDIDSVLAEAADIRRKRGVKEVILVGQDITSFRIEKNDPKGLVTLIRELDPVMEGGWIRLLYTHPARFSDELIDVINSSSNVCNYVDLPIQHINDRILEQMRRPTTGQAVKGLIKKIRERIEGVVLRTSVIVGFPGETDREFMELMGFLRDVKFERLGAFLYSREENTPAAVLPDQVPEEIKQERMHDVMTLQKGISTENNARCLGLTMRVLIDEEIEEAPGQFIGRTYMDAPEVDGTVYIKGRGIFPGDFVDTRITGTMEYDLLGEPV